MFDFFRLAVDQAFQDLRAALEAGIASFSLALILVITRKWHGVYSMDSADGVQKVHLKPTPRIGGVAIFGALVIVVFRSSPSVQGILIPILCAGFIAFAFGLAEDFTQTVGVFTRLIATICSGIAAWYLTKYSLTRLDIVYIDVLLQYLPVSVLFTAFAVGGVANAINIIDGLNGLSISTSFWVSVGIASISYLVGDVTLMMTAVILAFALLGFLFINWPSGIIFLGDGGAYFVGFTLAWLCVLLTERHSNVSAFVALLLCIYPITEVIFSIFRRRIKYTHPGHPDRLHLHSLFKTRVINKKFIHYSKLMRNSIAGIIIGAITVVPVCVAQYVYHSTRLSLFFVVLFIFMYIAIYVRLVHFRWYSPIKFLFLKPYTIKKN